MFASFQSTKAYRSHFASAKAFTIVELLIAATITVGIVVLLGSMFSSLANTASRANQRIDSFRDARAALQTMERDLTSLVKAQQTAYFALDKRWQPGGSDKPDAYANQSSNAPNHQIFALVATKDRPPGTAASAIGDLCAVGYYCRWEGNRYTLRRFFRHSPDVYRAIQQQVSGGSLSYTGASALYTPSSNPSNDDDVLASYVFNLQITAYKPDGTQDTTYPIVIDPSNPNAVLPSAIEIQFNAISPNAARTIMSASTDPKDWMDTTSSNYQRLIRSNVYQFRSRIQFD